MATPLEDKLVTWIKTKITSGENLEMLKKIYSDPPRHDLSSSSFPRAWVKELTSPSQLRGMGTTKREYDYHVRITIYLVQDTMVTKGASSYSSPEQAISKIAYDLIDEINTNWISDLAGSGDPATVTELWYEGALVTNEFIKIMNVLKGEVHQTGRYYR